MHIPVLLHESINSLHLKRGDVVVDATVGEAGHSKAIAKVIGETGTLICFDADTEALSRAEDNLKSFKGKKFFINDNFRNLKGNVHELGLEVVDKVFMDLGVGSHTYDRGLGFSFMKDEPLRMTLNSNQSLTAYDVVNTWGEESLADIIYGFGEERFSRRIARAIVTAREVKPIETSGELADLVKKAVPLKARFGKTHPATKTFQAIRIAVNDELGALSEGLETSFELLKKDGILSVISFHSLEDRIVKRFIQEKVEKGEGDAPWKKPVVPSDEEIHQNPRSRSSKLRVIQKII